MKLANWLLLLYVPLTTVLVAFRDVPVIWWSDLIAGLGLAWVIGALTYMDTINEFMKVRPLGMGPPRRVSHPVEVRRVVCQWCHAPKPESAMNCPACSGPDMRLFWAREA